MKPEHFKFYQAEIRVKNRATLKPTCDLVDGTLINVQAGWIIDDGEYKGQWAMVPLRGFWMPEEDLILKREITMEKYLE